MRTGGWCRRSFVRGVTMSAAAFWAPGVFAEELMKTPSQTEGPFYPNKLPLDTDNDLIVVNDATTPAIGTITHLTGKILGPSGSPMRNVLVEIWQCDNNGAYLHTRSGNSDRRDGGFQGFGRFLTGSNGEYYFRTIRPVPYPGRTPHIHFKIKAGEKELLTTQCYIRGEKQNERDGVLKALQDPKAKDALMVDFKPLPESKIGSLTANFDIVLGNTPEQS